MNCTLAAINLYPVKAAAGISLDRVQASGRGLAGDRLWLLTDSKGLFLSQRTRPSLALIQVAQVEGHLRLSAPGLEPLDLAPPVDGPRTQVTIWKDTVAATAGPDQAADWFSRFLGQECRLAFMDDSCRRPVTLPSGQGPDLVSFADGFPCLLISTASLDLLNTKLGQPVPMNRFRPNLVVTGCPAHQEDKWGRFRIGGAVFRSVKPCARCSVPAIDQETALLSPQQEPLRTLATYRSQPGGVMFGVNLLVEKEGPLAIGDLVEFIF